MAKLGRGSNTYCPHCICLWVHPRWIRFELFLSTSNSMYRLIVMWREWGLECPLVFYRGIAHHVSLHPHLYSLQQVPGQVSRSLFTKSNNRESFKRLWNLFVVKMVTQQTEAVITTCHYVIMHSCPLMTNESGPYLWWQDLLEAANVKKYYLAQATGDHLIKWGKDGPYSSWSFFSCHLHVLNRFGKRRMK